MLNLARTKITEAKGTSTNVLHVGGRNSVINIMHAGLPLISPDDVPNFDSYIGKFITKYNKYLGFSSGITSSSITNALDKGEKLFTLMMVLKRFYDSKGYVTPTGKTTDMILGNKIVLPDPIGSHNTLYEKYRIHNNLRKLSNAEWNSYFISPFSEILLPPTVMQFYDYYLSNYFDITNKGNNESLDVLTFWPEMQGFTITSIQQALGDDWTETSFVLQRTTWDTAVANLRNALTDDVQEFVTVFLDWEAPKKDMTRDLDGNSVNILRDNSLEDQLNNMYPEEAYSYFTDSDYAVDLSKKNTTCRIYRDFEPIYKPVIQDGDVLAESYYYALRSDSISKVLWTNQDELKSIVLDYNYMLFMALMATNEHRTYKFTIYSMITSFGIVDGVIETRRNEVIQFSVGSDIEIEFLNETLLPFDPADLPLSAIAGVLTDYNDSPEYLDDISIFHYGFAMKEYWIITVSLEESQGFCFGWAVGTVYLSYNGDEYINDFWLAKQGFVHVLSPNEVNSAIEAVSFRFLSIYFDSLPDAVFYLEDMFRDRVQIAAGNQAK